jgi:hypothetical protein
MVKASTLGQVHDLGNNLLTKVPTILASIEESREALPQGKHKLTYKFVSRV